MKTFLLLALLACVAASTAFGQFEDVRGSEGGYEQCQEEEQTMMMGSCRDYLMRRCMAMPISWPWKWGMTSCKALRQRCCQELAQTAPRCRCKAICRTIQGELGTFFGSRQAQMASSLPSMCNMYPGYCNISTTGGCY